MTLDESLRELMIVASFAVVAIYHIHFYYVIKRTPLKTSIGLTNHLRRVWVKAVTKNVPDVIPVQTLRNQIMSASFLASTAVLLSLAMLHVAFTPPNTVADVSQVLHFLSDQTQALWRVKWLVLAIDLFFAFFNFTLAIRHLNHASFMLNVPREEDEQISVDVMTKVLNLGAIHNTLGMRGYYFTIPLIMWLFSPFWLLVGSISLLAILYVLDRQV